MKHKIYFLFLTAFFWVKGVQAQAELEPNNSFATANPLSYGIQTSGTITCSSDPEDYFKTNQLTGRGNMRFIVEATNTGTSGAYLYFNIWDKNLASLHANYVGNTSNVAVNTTVYDTITLYCRSDDTVLFRLSNLGQCATFSYKIRYEVINDTVQPAFDLGNNDSFSVAPYFSINDTIKGSMGYLNATATDANDYYKTFAPTDGILRIYFYRSNTSTSANAYNNLEIFTKNKTSIYNSFIGYTSPGITRYDTVNIYCRSSDSLYFRVHSPSGCMRYQLRYEIINTSSLSASDLVNNDSFAVAVNLSENDTVKGSIRYEKNSYTDVDDYYKTFMQEDGTLRIHMERTNTSSNNGGYVYVTVYDKNKNAILNDFNGYVNAGDTRYDTINIYCRASDSIYFRMNAASTCFRYKLRYEIIRNGQTLASDVGDNDDFVQAVNIAENDTVKGNIRYASGTGTDNYDFFKTLTPRDGIIRIYMDRTNTSNNNSGYHYLAVYDKNRTLLLNVFNGYVDAGMTRTDTINIYCRTADSLYFRIGDANTCFKYKLRYEIIGNNHNLSFDTANNDGFSTAINISEDDVVNGSILYANSNSTDAEDYYKTLLPEKGTLRLYMERTNTSPNNSQYFYFALYNKSQGNLYSNFNGYINAGETRYDTLDFYCMPADSVYFRIHSASNCFSYKLQYELTLGADTLLNVCPGFTTDISNLYNTKPFNLINWTNMGGGAMPPLNNASPGLYRLTVEQTSQSCSRDTAFVTVGLHPKPNIGNDTTANVCPGFTTDLTQFKNTMGLTTQWFGTATPTAAGPGTYTLIVTNIQGCMDTATITIGLHPKPNIGNDTTANICPGFTADLTQFKNTTGLTTQWIGTATPTTVGAGTYTLIVTNVQGCMDTAVITIGLHPKPNIGNDTTANICPGFTADLTQFKNTSGLTSQWIGTATPTTVVAGIYTLIVTNVQGCMDTAVITIGLHPKPNIGNDTIANICPGFTTDLTQFKNTTGLTTQWIGTATPTTVVAGTYTLIVTNVQGCMDTTVFTIGLHPKPNIGNDTAANICTGTTIDLTQFKNTTGLTTQWIGTSTPTTAVAGSYTLIAVNTQGCTDTASINIISVPPPSLGNDTAIYAWIGENINFIDIRDTSGFAANGWTHSWTSNVNGTTGNTLVTVNTNDTVNATLIASSLTGCADTTLLTIYPAKNILPATGTTALSADVESIDPSGWTHYYNTNGTTTKSDDVLLLSLKKNGNNIGTVGIGAFNVQNVATQNAGSNSGIQITNPLMSNSSDYYTMHRFWNVIPAMQPTSDVGVRFYFNTQDYNDINGSFSNSKTVQDMILYHLKDGNPDPTTNWSGATLPVVSILNNVSATNTTWTYTNLGNNKHYAEFTVNSFSGGGAGFTGNNGPLPVTITAFTIAERNEDALLDWRTQTEKNITHYEIQRSMDGKSFNTIYTAKANNDIRNNYRYVDAGIGKTLHNVYYRLKINDYDGTHRFSEVLNLTFSGSVQKEIVLFPNPAKDNLTLTGVRTYNSLLITDVNGKVILTKRISLDKETISIDHFAAGTYSILLTNSNNSKTIQFIKKD